METELAAMAMAGHIQQNRYIYFIYKKIRENTLQANSCTKKMLLKRATQIFLVCSSSRPSLLAFGSNA